MNNIFKHTSRDRLLPVCPGLGKLVVPTSSWAHAPSRRYLILCNRCVFEACALMFLDELLVTLYDTHFCILGLEIGKSEHCKN